ncbi:hypothetical protein ASPACDRAFT_127998 [Aspergillus aculeatus ATCC 16872]|uniref:F-box domain-containing protein n=1 Tax=Aspergillus aculeatus (strain ATCC 16872 / CBS 172.66 / WB 5094) TaxID=690307 RepID=A0A1L9WFF8_ASPA1|nr:uncharacterized protein ASPACDRAFT_127998 [Aspergillus aculeatus ATCC 16872]OJJ94827.1 hypothetical protein ASPACDRAFT_127998 [Aspergillus aculeatus ATCC 16872]
METDTQISSSTNYLPWGFEPPLQHYYYPPIIYPSPFYPSSVISDSFILRPSMSSRSYTLNTMPTLDLPPELILMVANHLTKRSDINALARANRRLHSIVNPYLYRQNARQQKSSALVWAARRGVPGTARHSIAAGADVNIQAKKAPTPLCIAAMRGRAEVVRLLLQARDIDANRPNTDGNSPLILAITYRHTNVLRVLLESGLVDVNSGHLLTPLLHAAFMNNVKAVKLLLEQDGIDVNVTDFSENTAIRYAAAFGFHRVMRVLIEDGRVEVDEKCGENGQTPLSRAAATFFDATVKLLLRTRRVDVNSRDNQGRTPLSWAAETGAEGAVRMLLKAPGVEVDVRDHEGCTPLSLAARKGHEAVVRRLLATGKVDVDSLNENGWSPLFQAVVHGHEGVKNLLLAAGRQA